MASTGQKLLYVRKNAFLLEDFWNGEFDLCKSTRAAPSLEGQELVGMLTKMLKKTILPRL